MILHATSVGELVIDMASVSSPLINQVLGILLIIEEGVERIDLEIDLKTEKVIIRKISMGDHLPDVAGEGLPPDKKEGVKQTKEDLLHTSLDQEGHLETQNIQMELKVIRVQTEEKKRKIGEGVEEIEAGG